MISQQASPEFEALLEYLKRTRSIDFTGYKRTSLLRRVNKRMQMVGVQNYPDYLDYLELHPDEFPQLFNTILINVTTFFRDANAWEFLGREVLGQLLDAKTETEPVRAWSAGCASGEEAYTLAMLLAEKMGLEQARERIKIYATDMDDDALNHARQAGYSEKDVEGVPPELLEKYFERTDKRFIFRKDLRRTVIFGRHNLLEDAPISRIDVLVCRNTLMYFNAEAQAKILARLQFALNNGGCLFLGRAETLLSQNSAFAPLDLKKRIFTKLPSHNGIRERMALMGGALT